MSGLVKGIGKVFKKVINLVKKIAPIVLMVGAVALTGGAAAGALGAGGAAAAGGGGFLSNLMGSLGFGGAAGTTTAGVAASTAGAAGAAGASAAGGGLLSGGSGIFGKVIAGAAQGFMEAKAQKEEERQTIRGEERRAARYEGTGDAGSFNFEQASGPIGLGGPQGQDVVAGDSGSDVLQEEQNGPLGDEQSAPQMLGLGIGSDQQQMNGLGAEPQNAMDAAKPDAGQQNYRAPRTPVRVASSAGSPPAPKYRYNPQTKRIEY